MLDAVVARIKLDKGDEGDSKTNGEDDARDSVKNCCPDHKEPWLGRSSKSVSSDG